MSVDGDISENEEDMQIVMRSGAGDDEDTDDGDDDDTGDDDSDDGDDDDDTEA